MASATAPAAPTAAASASASSSSASAPTAVAASLPMPLSARTPRHAGLRLEQQLRADSLRQPHVPPRERTAESLEADKWSITDLVKMRKVSHKEWASGPESLTHETLATPRAKESDSYLELKYRRTKHTRKHWNPTEAYVQPVSIAHEIGWRVDPAKMTTFGPESQPRCFHPRSTCRMTQHAENMYQTCAQNIIRRF
eukprot:TRINITY_DN84187_c0_g1_i1.p1 TRINITY_DN84187_c0_g1~~TRINITY_DN84187_c0_g1_i1.p1  ORF type:complete len:197 (-),score=31.38 TRINITY_DN84187_c0_g1_i1:137-727(-)